MSYETQGMQGVPDDQRAAYARHMRWSSQPEFGLNAHSVFTLLPPDKYFAEHPDFYSEINGKRVAPLGIDLEFDRIADRDLARFDAHLMGVQSPERLRRVGHGRA